MNVQATLAQFAAATANLPPAKRATAVLIDAIGELNRTPGTLTDEQQARALQRILSERGWSLSATPMPVMGDRL